MSYTEVSLAEVPGAELSAFLNLCFSHSGGRSLWNACRLSIRQSDSTWAADSSRVWRDEQGSIAAALIREAGDFSVITHPHSEGNLEQMIYNWVLDSWEPDADERDIYTLVPDADFRREELLRSLGFESVGEYFLYIFDLFSLDFNPSDVEGFFILGMDEDGHYNGRVRLLDSVFIHEEFDLELYGRIRKLPVYDSRLDLAVIDEEGTHVSLCLGLLDKKESRGEIELIATDSHFRRQGLATLGIRECFYRMKHMDAERVYIYGDNPFFDALSPSEKISFRIWMKFSGQRK